MLPIAKVLIFAERKGEVLVFDEPDFPAVPLQVPGGTVEEGETPLQSAEREFHEETGLATATRWSSVGCHDYIFDKGGTSFHHRRHAFLTHLPDDTPDEWIHYEEHAFDGSPPICFRLHFLPFVTARRDLGLGMDIPLFWPALADFFR